MPTAIIQKIERTIPSLCHPLSFGAVLGIRALSQFYILYLCAFRAACQKPHQPHSGKLFLDIRWASALGNTVGRCLNAMVMLASLPTQARIPRKRAGPSGHREIGLDRDLRGRCGRPVRHKASAEVLSSKLLHVVEQHKGRPVEVDRLN
jgi:hypothetical protein